MSLNGSSIERKGPWWFQGTQCGENYFHGRCSQIIQDDFTVTLIGRSANRYSFEPDSPEARVEQLDLKPITFLKADFKLLALVVPPSGDFKS